MNNLPTEAMIDAARPLFLALEAGATSIEDVREQMSHGGRTQIDLLPDWFLTGRGHLTKSGRAEIAWWLMRAQEPMRPHPADEAKLRQMLAFQSAGAMLYTDDGELQDNRAFPQIDFKRDPVDLILRKMRRRTLGAAEQLLRAT